MRQVATILTDFLQRPFIRDAVTLQAGAVVSTGLSFVASLVYARVLGPELFGTYSLIIAFAAIVAVFFDLGAVYSTITLLSEAVAKGDRGEVRSVLGYYLKLSILISIFVGGAAILLAPFISRLAYGRADVGEFARWFIAGQAFLFLFVFFALVLQSIRRMRFLAIIENIQRFLEKALPILFVLLGLELIGISIGYFAAFLVMAIVALLLYSRFERRSELFPPIRELFGRLRNFSIKKYFWFGFQIAVDKNLGDVLNLLPVLLLGAFAPRETVGHFRIAFAYMALPAILIAPISRLLAVHFPQLKPTEGIEKLKEQFWKTALWSGALAVALVIPFFLLGEFLVTLFYGEAFRPAISLLPWLIPYPILIGLGVGLGAIFRTLNQVKAAIVINGATLIIGAPFVYLLTKQFGVQGTLWSVLFWTAVPIIVSLFWIARVFRHHESSS